MDLNIKIIEGVREFPALYDNRGNLDERNQAWLQLAEKLKMHGIIDYSYICLYYLHTLF